MPQFKSGLNSYFCLEDDMSSIENFLHLGKKKHFKKGDLVLPIGERITQLYYLKQGRAGRLIIAANGAEKFIKVVCDQGIVGEVLFFQGHMNQNQFIAVEDCECYLFDAVTVYDVLLKDEQIVRDLIGWFCRRMNSLYLQVEDSLIKDPHYRICKFLLEFVQEFGIQDGEGRFIYQGKLSHYDIAKYLGINRVSVTNVMKVLQEKNIIQKERQKLIILDKVYLEKL